MTKRLHDPDDAVALKQEFLGAYGGTRSFRSGCKATGVTPKQIHNWQSEDDEFKESLDFVREKIQGELEDAGIHRAIGKDGKGSDLLMMFFLKAMDPLRYREVATLSEVQEAGKEAMKQWRQGFKVEQREAEVTRREEALKAKEKQAGGMA